MLNVWAIYDNLALLGGRYLAIDLPRDRAAQWGLLQSAWRKSVSKLSDARAAKLVELAREQEPRLTMVEQLRNRAIHQARARPIRVASEGTEEARLWLEGGTWQQFEAALSRDGAAPRDWGIDRVFEPRRERIIVTGAVDGEGKVVEEYEIDAGPSAWLDPVALAPRIAAHAAWLADQAFAILDPSSDDRIPGRESCGEVPTEVYFDESGATSAIAASSLSGMVDWRRPLAGDTGSRWIAQLRGSDGRSSRPN